MRRVTWSLDRLIAELEEFKADGKRITGDDYGPMDVVVVIHDSMGGETEDIEAEDVRCSILTGPMRMLGNEVHIRVYSERWMEKEES